MKLGPVSLVVQYPQLRGPLIGSLIGRFPLGVASVAVMLSVQKATGSTRIAGLVAAAATIGVAVGAPIQARMLDKLHRRRVLAAYAAVQTLVLCALAAATTVHAPPGVIMALSGAFGLSIPSLTVVTKWVLRSVVSPDQLGSAFALDASTLEFLFIIGPSAAALTTAYLGPVWALSGCAAANLLGTVMFLRSCDEAWLIPSRPTAAPAAARGGTSRLVVVLVLSTAMMTMALGLVELAITHLSVQRHTSVAPVGLAFSAMSVGSLIGGLVYGSITWRVGLATRFVALALANAAFLALLILLPGFPLVYADVAVAGLCLAPLFSLSGQVMDKIGRRESWMQAQTWNTVASTGGQAVGTAIGGTLAAAYGSALTFGLSAAAVLLAVVFAVPALIHARVSAGQSAHIADLAEVSAS